MKFVRLLTPAAGASLLCGAILLPGCSDTEDVHFTYCRELIEARVGSAMELHWQGSEQEIRRPEYAKITLSFEVAQAGGASAPMQAACFYKYATADENVMTHSNPLSAYATVPYRLTVNDRDVSVEVLHAAVKEAAVQQGRELVEAIRAGTDQTLQQVQQALDR